VDLKIEVIVLPVSDVDRAKDFSKRLGFREDVDYVGADGLRVVHFTPPGSAASMVIGGRVTEAAPGSARGVDRRLRLADGRLTETSAPLIG
jgi:catechol 2,3-dioxygenase-like lactoylglutathione lyase family enzyme